MPLIEDTLFGRVNKVQKAIDRLKAFEPEDGYWLAFSGGKDSVVIRALAQMAEVKHECHYSITSVDPPEAMYEEVRGEIPAHIGVFTESGGYAKSAKRAKRVGKKVGEHTLFKSMIRSLSREFDVVQRSGSEPLIKQVERREREAQRETQYYKRKYWDLYTKTVLGEKGEAQP